MPQQKFIVGSRGSHLALIQTQIVIEKLTQIFPNLNFDIKIIKTTGDKLSQANPLQFPTKGAFTKEIEEALLKNEIDFAVHSLKDLPTDLPDQLMISAFLERFPPEDVLISKDNKKFADLPLEARIGTSSLRRKVLLNRLRPDLQILPLRGNVDTRLKKLEQGEFDAIVMAYASLLRLGLNKRISEIFSIDAVLPAVGQGTIAIECNQKNHEAIKLTRSINHPETEIVSLAERAFLNKIGGGCRSPIACYAWISSEYLLIDGMISSSDGKTFVRHKISAEQTQPEIAGKKLAKLLFELGAKKIIFTQGN